MWSGAANIAGAAAKLGASLATVPLVVGYLGRDAYGLAVTIASVALWLTVLDLGIGLSLKNALVAAAAREESALRAELVGAAVGGALSIVLPLGVVAGALILTLDIEALFRIHDAHLVDDARTLLLAAITIVLLNVPLSFTRQYFAAEQQEYVAALIGVLGSVASIAALICCIRFDLGFVWAGLAPLIGHLAANLALAVLAESRIQWVSRIRLASPRARHLAASGLGFFVIQVSQIGISQANAFLANYFGGNSAAAVYSVHAQFASYISTGIGLVVSPFWAPLGDAWARNDRAWIAQTLRRLVSVASLFSLAAFGLAVAFGHAFFLAWTRNRVPWEPILGISTLSFSVMTSIIGIPALALGSFGIATGPARVIVVQAVLNLCLVSALALRMGALGVAIGTLASYALTSAWYVPWRLRRALAGSSL